MAGEPVKVEFFGVRGSTPCDAPGLARYGGNTSCVVLTAEGEQPLILDLGTGLRGFGVRQGVAPGFHGTVLLSHLHWDHVQGLPFFLPLHHGDNTLTVHAPEQDGGEVGAVFAEMMRPPFFPITPDGLAAGIRFVDTGDDDFAVGEAKVRARWTRHPGPTLGYRVDWHGVSVAYVPDHGPGCCPSDPDHHVPDEILDLADGVDLLIHDAQHTADEFATKRHWGHCTPDYAVHVARLAGTRRLALFHHDPQHDDAWIDRIARDAADLSDAVSGAHVLAAAEGMVVELTPGRAVVTEREPEVDLVAAEHQGGRSYTQRP